jgi:hypothetical protein
VLLDSPRALERAEVSEKKLEMRLRRDMVRDLLWFKSDMGFLCQVAVRVVVKSAS